MYEEDQPTPINEVAQQVGVHSAANQNNALAIQNQQMQYQQEEQEKSLADAQLDCEETLTRINHLLKQDVVKVDEETGILTWHPISDPKKRVLTDEGVETIMQFARWYINKETLLSNFDEKMINRRMLEASLTLSATLFLKYEVYFRTPSQEECYCILRKIIDGKIESKEKSCKLMKKPFDREATEREILKSFEGREEYEIEKIRSEKRKENLREFEKIFRQLIHLIEATHNRAWRGEERGSLRRHFNISEVIGGKPQQQFQGRKPSWRIF